MDISFEGAVHTGAPVVQSGQPVARTAPFPLHVPTSQVANGSEAVSSISIRPAQGASSAACRGRGRFVPRL